MAACLARAAASFGRASPTREADRRHQAAHHAAATPAVATAAAAAARGGRAGRHSLHARRSQRVHWTTAAAADSEGNGAAEPAEASPPAPAAEGRSAAAWLSLLRGCMRLVQANLWPLVLVHCLADAVVFLLHRASHRLTNQGECCGRASREPVHGCGPLLCSCPSPTVPNCRALPSHACPAPLQWRRPCCTWTCHRSTPGTPWPTPQSQTSSQVGQGVPGVCLGSLCGSDQRRVLHAVW